MASDFLHVDEDDLYCNPCLVGGKHHKVQPVFFLLSHFGTFWVFSNLSISSMSKMVFLKKKKKRTIGVLFKCALSNLVEN